MRTRKILDALAIVCLFAVTVNAAADETTIRVGAIDAVLTVPSNVERPPVALLIAGSGSTDRDGNGPQVKPATLKKLAEQLAARRIATLRYDKRGAGGWKPEFGRPEDFRFKDYVDDAAALVSYLRSGGKFSRVVLVGHSEGGLVAILTARRTPVDRLVLLATAARRQGDLLKAQLEKTLAPEMFKPIRCRHDRRRRGFRFGERPALMATTPRPSTAAAPHPIDPRPGG
jgi:pimeloyl-ACP methyl ester carboxylesterase